MRLGRFNPQKHFPKNDKEVGICLRRYTYKVATQLQTLYQSYRKQNLSATEAWIKVVELHVNLDKGGQL